MECSMLQEEEFTLIMARLSQSSTTYFFFNLGKNLIMHGQKNTTPSGRTRLSFIANLFSHCYARNTDTASLNKYPSSLVKAKHLLCRHSWISVWTKHITVDTGKLKV